MNGPDLTGWYVGLAIGALTTFAIVVLVAMVLALARTLAAKSSDVALALRQARRNTDAIPDVAKINVETHQTNVLLVDLCRELDVIFPGGAR